MYTVTHPKYSPLEAFYMVWSLPPTSIGSSVVAFDTSSGLTGNLLIIKPIKVRVAYIITTNKYYWRMQSMTHIEKETTGTYMLFFFVC